MGNKCQQLTIEERCEIARLRTAGHSQRQIAASLDRAPSTVARELKRNSSRTRGTSPAMPSSRHGPAAGPVPVWNGMPPCASRSWPALTQAWPPEQVSGRQVSSHESSYRFIYAQLARKKEYSWRRYIPRAKFKWGYRGRRGGSPASFIAQRRPLSQRPQDAADRRSPGHWEAGLMLFRTYGQVVLTLHERHSRLLIARRAPARPLTPSPSQWLASWPPSRPSGASVSPSTTAPSSPGITNSMPGASRPSSAMSAPPGRMGGGERHRQNAPLPAPQDRPGHPAPGTLLPTGPSLQQYPAPVPGV